MAKLFLDLRAELARKDIDMGYLGEKLGLSRPSISARLCGKQDWRLSEMYECMNVIHKPYNELGHFFPPSGVCQYSDEECKR